MAFDGTYLETTGDLAPISRYDESKMYLALGQLTGVAVTDSDLNEVSVSLMNQIRRVTSFAVGDGSPNDGYKIEESGSPSNNFTVKGGSGTADTAGRIFVDGWPLLRLSDADYVSNTPLLHSRVTAVSTTTLTDDTITDAAANWGVNALVGRTLCPDISVPGTTYTISANTATTITVSASMTGNVAVGDYYRVNLSTPGGARTDKVYLDVFLDEAKAADDSDLSHSIGAPPTGTETARRVMLRGVVRVVENGTHGGNYTDSNGQQHWISLLATLSRTASANLVSAEIQDERPVTGSADGSSEQTIRPIFKIISTFDVSTSISEPDPSGDFHSTYSVTSTDDTRRIDYLFSGWMGSGNSVLEWIRVPIWGDGSYRMYIYTEGSGQIYDSTLTSTPGSRTMVEVNRFEPGWVSPSGEGRFIVRIEVYLDNAETFNSGPLRARHY